MGWAGAEGRRGATQAGGQWRRGWTSDVVTSRCSSRTVHALSLSRKLAVVQECPASGWVHESWMLPRAPATPVPPFPCPRRRPGRAPRMPCGRRPWPPRPRAARPRTAKAAACGPGCSCVLRTRPCPAHRYPTSGIHPVGSRSVQVGRRPRDGGEVSRERASGTKQQRSQRALRGWEAGGVCDPPTPKLQGAFRPSCERGDGRCLSAAFMSQACIRCAMIGAKCPAPCAGPHLFYVVR